MHSPRPSLPFGKFFGTREIRKEIPGFSLALLTPVLRAEDVPLHTHQDASFVLLLSGSYLSSADDACSECASPVLIYNPPQTTHRDRFKSVAGRFLGISISRESLASFAEFAALPTSARCFTSPKILHAARAIARNCATSGFASPLQMEESCFELLGKITSRVAMLRGAPPRWLQTARELLHDQCAEPLRIATAAQRVGVSPVHFARSFRHFLRCTPGEYLTRCRLQKALSVLRHAEIPLSEVALQSGFFDQSHFNHSFKKHFGLAPRAYRRELSHAATKIHPAFPR